MSKKIQLKGPFKAETELLKELYEKINKISIFCKPEHFITINGMTFEIGKTGMLEIEGTNIESLKFQQDEDENTYIDFLEL